MNRFLIAFVSFFLVLLFFNPSKALGLNLFRASGSKTVVLNELESIRILKPIESPKLQRAVADFNALWASRIGYLLKIESPSFGALKGIHLRLSNRLKSKKPGSFLLRMKDRGILVDAFNEEGLVNALYYLAHNMLGARWYWPTPLGFEWAGDILEIWEIPDNIIEPSFIMRSLNGSNSEYSLRNRLVGGYSFNHNLAKIFKPEIIDIAPNIFTKFEARKIVPKGSTVYDPQPNLTNEGAVELTALAAIRYFKKNPSAKSFSLSPNDNVLYDTTQATEKAVSPITYFRERPNYTDMIFNFANQVAHKVFNEAGLWKTAHGEDRYLGMLAYYWSEQSPSIILHPRVLPVLTSDRSQWHDSSYRQEDKALIKRWGQTMAEKIGAWDYYFGAPYPYPRQFIQWISESIPYLYSNRVDIFFSQLPSMWGLDGAKGWLTAQLLWNVDADVEMLLNEFYNEFFGHASQSIRAFYEIAESHRNQYEGTARWIKFYLDESGIELFPKSTLEIMRSHIEIAKSSVPTSSRYYRRILIVSEAFELTELYHAYHFSRLDLLSYITGKDVIGGVERVRNLELKRDNFINRSEELINNQLHKHFNYFLKLKQTDPTSCMLIPLMRKGESIDEGFKEKYSKLLSVANNWINRPHSFRTHIGNPLLKGSFENAMERDFLGPIIPEIKYWQIDFRPAEAFAIESVSLEEDSSKGLRILNADMFNIYTIALLASQRNYLLKAKISSKISPDCRAQLRLDWLDASGVKLESLRMIQLPNGESNGCLELEIPLIAPKTADKAKISLLLLRQGEDDYVELREINFLGESS